MVDITPIFNAGAFDPETVRTMTHAFDDCRKTIPDTHDHKDQNLFPDYEKYTR
jgi:hypothetical protein